MHHYFLNTLQGCAVKRKLCIGGPSFWSYNLVKLEHLKVILEAQLNTRTIAQSKIKFLSTIHQVTLMCRCTNHWHSLKGQKWVQSKESQYLLYLAIYLVLNSSKTLSIQVFEQSWASFSNNEPSKRSVISSKPPIWLQDRDVP